MEKVKENKKDNIDLKRDPAALKKRIWFVLNIFFSCVYLTWRLFFTIPLEYGMVSIIAGLALFAVEFLGLLEAMIHYINMYDVKTKDLPKIPQALYPEVDIFIATYNEPCELLFKTVNGCLHLQYPDKNKVHIYLCDDGKRAEVRELASKMGVNYLDREEHKHAKAGNLNHALSVTESPYIVTLDADMIPHRNFLMRTIPYFVAQEMENEGKEEKDQKHVGFVQSPQAFYNPDLFQYYLYSERRIPNEQDYFYRDIQVSRNKSNSAIYGGSNTVLSRRALDEIGGFFTGTITEDYGTGILMQKKGYVCFAINEVLAAGLSPTDLKSLVNQRIRWARGVISTNRKMHIFFSKDLSISQKINYWASEWYWFAPLKRLIYFLSPILYSVFGYMVIKCTLWEILLFWLPMYISSNISLRMMSQNIRTTKWTSIYETVLFPFLLVPVLMESVGITMKQFKVTKKGGAATGKEKNLPYLIPFALLVGLSVIGIINCLRIIFISNDMGPTVVLFWLFVNLYTLVMSMFFVLGRNFVRKSERAQAVMDCSIVTGGGEYTCKTLDISEHGVAVKLYIPINVDDEEEVGMKLWDGRYESQVKARVVHVDNFKDSWKYAFYVTDYCGTYEEYLQLVYDRVPTLPQQLDTASGSFDDLKLNVTRRATPVFFENRKLPRVFLNATLLDIKGKRQTVIDFNYKYCTLRMDGNPDKELVLVIDKEKEVFLKCRATEKKTEDRILYKVMNYDEIHRNWEKNQCLELWLEREWKNPGIESQMKAEKEVQKEEPESDFDEMKCL